MRQSRPSGNGRCPSLTLLACLRRDGNSIVQSIKRRALDNIRAVGNVAFAVGEKSRLGPLPAPEVADLLAADVKMGAVGQVTARNQGSDVAIKIAPLGRSNSGLGGFR